jgi:hypothetical protein
VQKLKRQVKLTPGCFFQLKEFNLSKLKYKNKKTKAKNLRSYQVKSQIMQALEKQGACSA